MPLTNFPYGVTSFGIPVIPQVGPISIPNKLGRVFFVDTTNGSDGNSGADPTQPLKTITKAHTLAGSGRGDTIFVFPGEYDETLIITKDYISIIGAVWAGYAKPDWGPAAAAGVALTVRGQGFQCRHMRIFANGADVLVQSGNGFLYEDCVFDGDGTASKGVRLVPIELTPGEHHHTASEGRICGSLFRGNAIGLIFDTAAPILGVGSTDNLIDGNRFYSNTVDIATAKTGAAGTYSAQLLNILGNFFADKNKATYVDITTNADGPAASQTGMIASNWFAADAITAGNEVKMVGTGFTFAGNFTTVGVKDGSGLD